MQWRGSEVDPDVTFPEPESWTAVDLPGRPDAFAGAGAVAYQTTFDDPRTGAESHAVLELRGLYGHATVYCNGTELGNHDTYFVPYRVALDEHLEAENDLRVVCRRPQDAFGGIHATDMVPAADAVPGIWWDARLRTYPGTYIDTMTARPELNGDDAAITVSTTLVADEDIDDRLTLSVREEGGRRGGMMERASVSAEAGQRVTVDHSIQLRDPARWWPAGLGDQQRYVVRAKFGGVEHTVTTGFATVSFAEGALRVNDTPVPVRGVNLLDATVADIERAASVNANLVRAHAHVPSQEVVEACTEAGLLLWQDLPLTGPATVDIERGQQLATALGRQYGNTPALAALTVHDDPTGGFEGALGTGLLDRLRRWWRARRTSYDDSAARAIADALPASTPTFPVVGPPEISPDAVTLYPGWHYGEAAAIDGLVQRHDPDVVGEFGAGALTDADLDETAGFDRAAHDAHTDSTDVEASQAYQASVVRRVAERLRQESTPIIAAFALRDTGDAGMGVFGRDGTPKTGAEVLSAAFEPVQAVLAEPDAAKSDVVVCNDRPERITGTLEWETPAESDSTDITVSGGQRATVTTVPMPTTGKTVSLRLSFDDRTVENSYDI